MTDQTLTKKKIQDYITILRKTPVFQGVAQEEAESVLHCLSARYESFKKGNFIYRTGDEITSLGIVLTGSIHIIKEDFWGNKSIISEMPAGGIFAETYACVNSHPMEVSVVAATDCTVVFLNVHKILSVCSSACSFHTRLIRNLLSALAVKNLMLTKKMEHMAKRTTRDKLLSYLSNESLNAGSSTFEIPFNRQQLADFLSVDRSAMSNELSKLRDEGIIEFNKNKFNLLEPLME